MTHESIFILIFTNYSLGDGLPRASDVATLRTNIINGQFETATGWGWSIMDRKTCPKVKIKPDETLRKD